MVVVYITFYYFIIMEIESFLAHHFPPISDDDSEIDYYETLQEHVSLANNAIECFFEKYIFQHGSASEHGNGVVNTKRRSILTRVLDTAISQRFQAIFQSDRHATRTRHSILEKATIGEVLIAVEWINKYELKLAGSHCLSTHTLMAQCHSAEGNSIRSHKI